MQRPHPPITIGGSGSGARCARWRGGPSSGTPSWRSPQDWLELKDVLAGHCAAVGRDVNEITCSVNVRIDPDAGLDPAWRPWRPTATQVSTWPS